MSDYNNKVIQDEIADHNTKQACEHALVTIYAPSIKTRIREGQKGIKAALRAAKCAENLAEKCAEIEKAAESIHATAFALTSMADAWQTLNQHMKDRIAAQKTAAQLRENDQ